jgi:hypothetical protein
MPKREDEYWEQNRQDNLKWDSKQQSWMKPCPIHGIWHKLEEECPACKSKREANEKIKLAKNFERPKNPEKLKQSATPEQIQGINEQLPINAPQNNSEPCPSCHYNTLQFNTEKQLYQCTNPYCNHIVDRNDPSQGSPVSKTNREFISGQSNTIHDAKTSEKLHQTEEPEKRDLVHRNPPSGNSRITFHSPFPNWMLALLLIFALCIIGIAIHSFTRNIIVFWVLFGFACIFSIEKWFLYPTRKYKPIGIIYRLVLNFAILALLGLLIWLAIKLFSHKYFSSSLPDSLILLGEFIIFIWLWRAVSKNSWRWPSMKLTVFTLICLGVVFAFAGVQPIAIYKDKILTNVGSYFNKPQQKTPSQNVLTTSSTKQSSTTTIKPVTIPTVTKPTSITPLTTVTSPLTTLKITPGNPLSLDKSSFQTIDQYALGTPETMTTSIDKLATYLIQPAKNDLQKSRAIYRWITQNISYDYSAYLTGNYGSTKASDVLTSRKSVCAGYSELFNALCKSAGIESVIIGGWAKGLSYKVGDTISGRTNHDWNAVKINSEWYLIDSTWGAGYISQGAFVREFTNTYFCTPPEQFIYLHFPEDSKWQLLSTPISISDFSALPYIYSDFFEFGVNLGKNTKSTINTQGNLSMVFTVSNDTFLLARVWQGTTKLGNEYASASRSGGQYNITARFPTTGECILTIYAAKDQYGMYDGIIDYKVIVTSSP